MDALSILALATQCVTAAPAPVVAAMAIAETNGSAYAVTIGDEPVSPADIDAAVQAAAIGLSNGHVVKIGIASVPTTEFDKRNIAYSDGFSICRNMAVAGDQLRESWQRFGARDEHWRLAVLEIATGNPGVEGDFAHRFDTAMTEVRKAAQGLRQPSGAAVAEAPAKPAARSGSSYADTETAPSEPAKAAGAWDVYGRDSSQSLLIFSK
ncbi:hypothetical protein CU102_03240 [Phyllobacterium brassicacearum]|uniref:DUF541 domain-containing protein n=1 Tax=Phyllobacterium brassicacearum TaxID=314235 RepID=A0A2P7BUI6_9HYPH|nr:hypothetical protein [Phyllobacterium brassicacearum]PSH70127.1 hypothetical protein CU102_03240 [Phyllobacterium brassicacearum]TDQ34003.1 hypothetical protein DEV91_104206 [Phyllobacterium brassicacearum]